MGLRVVVVSNYRFKLVFMKWFALQADTDLNLHVESSTKSVSDPSVEQNSTYKVNYIYPPLTTIIFAMFPNVSICN